MMKQVSQNYKSGSIRLDEVSDPALRPGGVIVRTLHSLISTGTEGMKVREARMSLLEKARARPDQVKKVLQAVHQQGVKAAYDKVMNKLDALTPLGYSLSGIVTAVGSEASEFTVGQRVACAGAEYAHHAEFNYVPRNLVVPVPDGVSMEHAAFTTVGAIALQGYRQSGLQLGETACVIGLGLIGQIMVQLLRASGVNVVGTDLSELRCQQALELGAQAAFRPDDPALAAAVSSLTLGHGADVIFITAGGNTTGPVDLAARVARDRARVVDIGKTLFNLPWTDYYIKEMDIRFSRSYGPGRYEPDYEEKGMDYPIGYVRWTENRNMSAFLDLVASGRVRLDPILSTRYAFEDAEKAYQKLAEGGDDVLGILFDYPADPRPIPAPAPAVTVKTPAPRALSGPIRLGVIGAGNYASSMLLPYLSKDPRVKLSAVATSRGLTAVQAARKFGFERNGTDAQAVLNDPEIDAVLIATRHATHAALTSDALRAGKAVFVEKPLAVDRAGTELIRRAVLETGNDRLQVGFNRRFAPLIVDLKKKFRGVTSPLVLTYRVHAGPIDAKSWYADAAEGSRFDGEAGHFIDCFAYLTGARPISVQASSIRPAQVTPDDLENRVTLISYENGSMATLIYLTQGGGKLPKENLEIHGANQSAVLDNFEQIRYYSATQTSRVRGGGINKGQKEELDAFLKALLTNTPMPFTIDELLDTTLITLASGESMRQGRAIALNEFWDGKS